MQKTILITGCSSGIGAAFAREFGKRGHRVYATARRAESLAALEVEGVRGLALDVNDDSSIARALDVVLREAGHLDLLVNNAGFSQVGAVVDLTREDLRRQYETNVIAPMAVTGQAVPLLRAAVAQNGSAVVANVGSIVGLFTTPFAAAYCSSKAAVHSLTDALRMELAPFGIHVVSIQPGGVRSSFGEHAEAAVRLPENSLYKPVEAGIRARAQAGQQGAMPADVFVVPVVDALLRSSPPRVIRGGTNSVRLPLLKRLLPAAMFDAKLSKLFGLDALR
ncbi:MAG: SDR family NAD(P)-dependent oxidoreductase [Steroidobacteraceae bacterium]|nr:SDR family NAD(P)-dependent oxidoreductase [Pseudomonadota bacterium]MBP7611064.1 SDR family NAD(P)-dependent oxidoreductase [Steroidobacteraceae bacterium]MBP9129244.1 SDR family NAD(P)-dependent oxidoreductase [Steroidobacteraceae bacterium]